MDKIKTRKMKIKMGFKGVVQSVDEGLLDFEYSTLCSGFTFSDGALKAEIGIDDAVSYFGTNPYNIYPLPYLPSTCCAFRFFVYHKRTDGEPDDRLVVMTSIGDVYFTKLFQPDTWHRVFGLLLDYDSDAVNYNYNNKDVLIFTSPNDVMKILDDTTVIEVESAPRFNSITTHYERIYGSCNGRTNQVWFSDDFNPENWTVDLDSAGYINFNDEYGDVIKVMSFLNYLYIFREKAIFRMQAYGDQVDFSITKLGLDIGHIHENTIAVCGDKIMFFADTNLFSFDGYNLTKIETEFTKDISLKYAVAVASKQKYCLACKAYSKNATGRILDKLIVYNPKDKNVKSLSYIKIMSLHSIAVRDLSAVFVSNFDNNHNRIGMIVDNSINMDASVPKLYESPKTNFDIVSGFAVRSLDLYTKYDIELEVIIDGMVEKFCVSGADRSQRIVIDKFGYEVKVRIISYEYDAYIRSAYLNIEV